VTDYSETGNTRRTSQSQGLSLSLRAPTCYFNNETGDTVLKTCPSEVTTGNIRTPRHNKSVRQQYKN